MPFTKTPLTPRCRRLLWLLFLAAGLVLGQSGACLATGMNGPPKPLSNRPNTAPEKVTAGLSQPLLNAIRFFQKYVSPIDGVRCQFSPTCSAFGHQAIDRHGPWLGVLMTADRLVRCGYGIDTDTYPRLPNGRLADPVAAN